MLAKRAIAARKRCTEWFAGKTTDDEGVRESNRKHGYFIGILEETLSTLRPRCPPETIDDTLMKAADEAEAGDADPLKLSNMFSALTLEKTRKEDQNLEIPLQPLPATAKGKPGQEKPRQYQVTCSKSAEETFFATYCFFDDLNKLRRLLRELWLKYDQGELNVITVSVITNTAFEFIQREEQDFLKSFKGDGLCQFEDFARLLLLAHSINVGKDAGVQEQEGDPFNFDLCEIYDWCCFHAFTILEAYTRILEPKSVPIYRPDVFGTFDPQAEWLI